MVANWPSTELFRQMPRLGNKFALSEKFNRKQYYSAIRSNIDLGYAKHPTSYQSALKTIKSIFKGQTPHRGAKLSARFEFQMMPANGGHILPHTDTPAKIVTLVVSILDIIDTFPFEPNQAVIFVKTFNSWHSVRPMTGPAEKMRKTLIINIEVPK